ncbi:MAG: PAS domain-containing protein, partial [Desulfobacterales bacterium]|nr:PAS domain-containing protein [Desulfobacterales bacterium]
TNVSLQKEMKERREVEDRLHRLFQNSLTGIAQHELLFDENGAPVDFRVIDVNPAYTRILGITRDEAVGAKASELYQSDPPPYFDVFSQVALGGEPRTFETWFAPMDKHFNIGVYSPGQGMFATVFEDIGKRKRGEVLLADALTKAEEANRAKSDFLANMSHELRTPLNAILGFAQIFLADKKLDRSVHEKAGLIKKSGEHLLTIINDVLDISKIEAGRLDVLPGPVCLPRFIRTIRNIFYEQARKKEITFELAMDEELPEWIEADKTRLRQVLINLLGNAVKFTRRGRVSLRVEDRGRVGNERASICFRIEDTGVGIPLEQQEIIFHPFEQAEEMKLKTEGT